jgi:hypothetical protein
VVNRKGKGKRDKAKGKREKERKKGRKGESG